MTLKQLCLFDGEVTMTRESTWIMFIVEISISRRKAFRHPTPVSYTHLGSAEASSCS